MKYDIILSRLAEVDLDEIWYYTYFNWGENQANLYLEQLNSGFKKIPNSSSKVISNLYSKFKCIKIKHHFIFYTIKENEIKIARILHKKWILPCI